MLRYYQEKMLINWNYCFKYNSKCMITYISHISTMLSGMDQSSLVHGLEKPDPVWVACKLDADGSISYVIAVYHANKSNKDEIMKQ